ncbi:MAG: anhydro-N-acetylmuramic acid kinase, partial [Bradyrhizobium sp.]
MSGTSLDGVDVALIETDGEGIGAFGPTGYRSYSDSERDLLRQALAEAVSVTDRDVRSGALADAESLVTRAHAEAVESFLAANNLSRDAIDVVGFHGQTVLHRPERKLTVQIGDGLALTKMLGIPVVFDLRAADVAAGGQGAPLVPVYHRALVQRLKRAGPTVVVNIGGVANMTYIDGETLIACDTGPGNALLDDFMLHRTGEAVDRDGRTATKGRADGE